jgi:RHS repeat-associated protein
VYVSNVSDEMVYFDNLQVTNNRGHIIEENHYYAYGLRIAGISSAKLPDPNEGHIGNKNLYNDKELIDDADLGWYDYGFRNYDPQIGRFTQLDPLTDYYPFLTPYQYASCEPIANIDIDGLEAGSAVSWAEDVFHNTLKEVVVVGVKKAAPRIATNTTKVAARLVIIAAHGAADALANANLMGAWEMFGDDLDIYVDENEKLAYLQGRLAGNVAALLQSKIEVGGSGGLLLASGGTAAPAAAGIAIHGVGVSVIAAIDIAATLKSLYRLQATGTQGNNNPPDNSVSDPGPELQGGFGIPNQYTYESSGIKVRVIPHAFKHLRELESNAKKLGANYLKLLGQTYQKSLHSAIDDVLSRGPIKFDYMYRSGGNEIMFGAPRNPGELPAVKHFR